MTKTEFDALLQMSLLALKNPTCNLFPMSIHSIGQISQMVFGQA
jgi:hypothetical protein